MPGSGCQAPWGYLLGVGGLLWGIWGDFVTLGVDKLRSLVYACKDHKVSEGLIDLGNIHTLSYSQ
jgi:hypothetical protein